MRPGTPGFNGARLREAREARGLSTVDLERLLGVSRQSISQYELGRQSPQPEVMDRICEVLLQPRRFFTRSLAPKENSTHYFRSLASATKKARLSASTVAGWVVEMVDILERHVELPRLRLPQFDIPANLYQVSEEDVEELALEARKFWNLGPGPISDLVLLLENNGVVVSRFPFGSPALDGFSMWVQRQARPYIVLNDEKLSAARSRFDAAHELGHLLLHGRVETAFHNRSEHHKLLEAHAHRFAGAFLFPRSAFVDEVFECSLTEFVQLKKRWKLSVGMMIMRALHLGCINERDAELLWRARSKRGWKKREPLDDQIPTETPRLLRRVIEFLLKEKVYPTIEDLLMALPFHRRDIEVLAALPTEVLNPDLPLASVTPIRPRRSDGPAEPSSGQVVPFKR